MSGEWNIDEDKREMFNLLLYNFWSCLCLKNKYSQTYNVGNLGRYYVILSRLPLSIQPYFQISVGYIFKLLDVGREYMEGEVRWGNSRQMNEKKKWHLCSLDPNSPDLENVHLLLCVYGSVAVLYVLLFFFLDFTCK